MNSAASPFICCRGSKKKELEEEASHQAKELTQRREAVEDAKGYILKVKYISLCQLQIEMNIG